MQGRDRLGAGRAQEEGYILNTLIFMIEYLLVVFIAIRKHEHVVVVQHQSNIRHRIVT